MYMEPQAALAVPDEGGAILVHSSTQCIDMVQTAVAAALGLPYNKVIARAPPAALGARQPLLPCLSAVPRTPWWAPAVQQGRRACAPGRPAGQAAAPALPQRCAWDSMECLQRSVTAAQGQSLLLARVRRLHVTTKVFASLFGCRGVKQQRPAGLLGRLTHDPRIEQ